MFKKRKHILFIVIYTSQVTKNGKFSVLQSERREMGTLEEISKTLCSHIYILLKHTYVTNTHNTEVY